MMTACSKSLVEHGWHDNISDRRLAAHDGQREDEQGHCALSRPYQSARKSLVITSNTRLARRLHDQW